MFLVLLKYNCSLSEVDQHIPAHRAFLDKHYQSNNFLCSGPMNPREGGVILAKAASRAALEKILSEDPFWLSKIADYQIIEFNPVKTSPEFSKCL